MAPDENLEKLSEDLYDLQKDIELDFRELRNPETPRRYHNDLCDEIIVLEYAYKSLAGVFYYSERQYDAHNKK
jgi:hypothetical protein